MNQTKVGLYKMFLNLNLNLNHIHNLNPCVPVANRRKKEIMIKNKIMIMRAIDTKIVVSKNHP